MIDVELGQVVHLSDVKLPEGVESVALSHGEDHDQAIANVTKPKGGADEDEEQAADDAEAGGDAESSEE
jgi:large subunit ribosomal protein L25